MEKKKNFKVSQLEDRDSSENPLKGAYHLNGSEGPEKEVYERTSSNAAESREMSKTSDILIKSKLKKNKVSASPAGNESLKTKERNEVMNVFYSDMLSPNKPETAKSKRHRHRDSDSDTESEEIESYYKRTGTFVEYGNDVKIDIKKAKMLEFHERNEHDDTDEDDDVYPLSIKYDRK